MQSKKLSQIDTVMYCNVYNIVLCITVLHKSVSMAHICFIIGSYTHAIVVSLRMIFVKSLRLYKRLLFSLSLGHSHCMLQIS